jgi:hypothetical protein
MGDAVTAERVLDAAEATALSLAAAMVSAVRVGMRRDKP